MATEYLYFRSSFEVGDKRIAGSRNVQMYWEVSMRLIPPHIINCSLVYLHCTLFCPGNALETKEPARTVRGVLLMRLALSRDEFELSLGVVAIVRLV
jgi:hypothetical protein